MLLNCSDLFSLATTLPVQYRKEIISFLRKLMGPAAGGRKRQRGGQDEVSSAMDWLVGSSQYQLPHNLWTF